MKQISLSELDLLKRILGMTFSNHDGEALAAMRKANAILTKYNLTWAEVLGRTVNVMSTPATDEIVEAGNTIDLRDQIRNAFNELRGVYMTPSFVGFLNSIEQDFRRNGYLSPAQRKPLFDAVKRHRRERKRDE